ncbi:MAG: hypothetical protein ACE5FE_06145, partial [Acidiferrobacterales bacterium]
TLRAPRRFMQNVRRTMRLGTVKDKYESLRPLIVWLGLTELVWISYWLLRTGDATLGYTTTVVAWIVAMLGWLALAIYVGRRGFFLEHSRWLSNLVGAVMVVTFAIVVFAAVPAAREGLATAATATTNRELASIHILRLLAIGTIIKYLQRELPLHFVILGALPDFLFAVSAVVVTFLVGNTLLGQDFLFAWHSIGFLVFFGAGISMFFSVPSPFRIYHGVPDTSIAFRFPMFLAPNFTVPLFMLAHAFALVKLTVAG